MISEEEKMLSSKLYNPTDETLVKKRLKVRLLQEEYNKTSSKEVEKREYLLKQIFGSIGSNGYMEPTIKFDYGCNTYIGDNFFANYNAIILDVAKVIIGNNVMFGPNVTVATPVHPLIAKQRRMREDNKGNMYDLEYAKPITIEDDVWVASNVVICGGVTIGKGTVIGAGSVVVRDIPANMFACGNPCKPIREISEKDRMPE